MPVLGICYGLQLIAHLLGGKVEPANEREYGAAQRRRREARRASSTASPSARRSTCGCRHGDRIAALPPGFQTIGVIGEHAVLRRRQRRASRSTASSSTPRSSTRRAAPRSSRRSSSTSPGSRPTWTPGSFAEEAIAAVRAKVGPDEHAVCGLSGGVDSSVAAVLCHKRARRPAHVHLRRQRRSCGRARPSRSSRRSARRFKLNLVARRRARAVPRARSRASPIRSRSGRSSGASSSRCSRRRPAKVEGRELPRAGHALPRRDRERLASRGRARSSRATTTSAGCPSG